MEQLEEASRGYGGEVREERGEPEQAGAQKPGEQGTWRRKEWMVSRHRQNVTGNEDQGDCGEGLGSGQWVIMNNLGDRSFGGKWQWLAVVLGSEGAERLS